MEEELLPVLPRLTPHHRILIAPVADPGVGERARGRSSVERGRRGCAERRSAAQHNITIVTTGVTSL